jgi:iron(III) transport system substrate-binding protein
MDGTRHPIKQGRIIAMNKFASILAAAAAGVAMTSLASAAELPKSTQKMLKALKLDASILSGVEDELKVPQAWLDAANNKEKQVLIYSTHRPKDWKKIQDVFAERYPGITIKQSEVRTSSRRYIRPLTAFKEGRYLTDITMGLSGNVYLFRRANAFANLSDLPAYKRVPDDAKQSDHIAVPYRTRYWCMSYNTKNVKKSELPKTWDDLVSSQRFGNKKLMIGNRPNNWLLNLWEAKGDNWGADFSRKLLVNLKPQLRKEGMSALLNLVILGEGDMAVPSAMNRVGPQVLKGAPIGYHCPEPVPFTVSELGVFKGAPHINAAKIWVNWLLSKEGQIAQYYAERSSPIHAELQRKEFLYFPEAVVGRKKAVLGPDAAQTSVRLARLWDPLWIQGGGYVPPKAQAVEVKIDAVKRGGRVIEFKVAGKADKAKISGSRTKIKIGGQASRRKNLKAGMICKVLYPSGGGEAKSVECK